MSVLSELPADQRLAGVGLWLLAAGADGVIDDDELFGIVGDLRVDTLPPEAQDLVAIWFSTPPAIGDLVPALDHAASTTRAGLVLRMVEVLGADGVVTRGEVERLTSVASALGVDEDQLGAMRAFVGDLEQVVAGVADPDARARRLMVAGSTLRSVGLPAGCVVFSGLLDGLEGLGPLVDGLGLEDPERWLGDPATRARRRSEAGVRLRESTRALTEAMHRRERTLAPLEAAAVGLRRRALERRLVS